MEMTRQAALEKHTYGNKVAERRRLQPRRKRSDGIGRLLRPSDAYLISFLIPVLIMILIFVERGIFPFGEGSFLRTDMYHQYAPFFSEFQSKLRSGGSLLYSWDVGMGVNFAALYAYYLASPLNFLIILCPKGLIIEFMTYMIVFKMGLSGLSMCCYLRKHCRTRDVGCAFFGIFYAMSGYMAAYSWNIMWLDCILLFPMIMLGLERLVREKKPFLYAISLGLSILSNYYISIMICLFLVMYFVCLLVLDGIKGIADLAEKAGHFALYSLLAGGMAMVTLLPEIFALQTTASGDFNFPKTFTQYFTIFDMIARHIGNVETEIGLDHWPNIYCGVAVFLLVALYVMNRRISIREKAVYMTLLVFFYLSFSVNVLNFIWHGFHYPNSLPCRQSFIYIFLVLLMSYRAYANLRFTGMRKVSIALGISMGYVVLAQRLVTDSAFHFIVFYVALLFLALYYLFIYLWKYKKASYNVIIMGVVILVTVESAVNMTVTSVTTTSRTAYLKDNGDVRQLTEEIQEKDQSFYRFEKINRKTKNDGAWMNFPSVSIFSSTAYAHCSDFFQRIGCESSTNAYSITGSTPLVNMLFGVKYGFYDEEPEMAAARGLEYVDVSGGTYLYRNRYSLPLGYMMTEEALSNWLLDIGTPALVQDSLSDALQTNPVLVPVLGTPDGDSYDFVAEEAGEYYVYVSNPRIKEVTVNYETTAKAFENVDRGFFLELGYLNAGELVNLRADTEGQDMECDVYRFDFTALDSIYNRLSESSLQLTSWEDTKVTGEIDVKETGVMLTSIPYDEGWSVWVDGVQTEIREVLDCFVGVNLTAGSHVIEFRYFPKGLKLGLGLSAGSILLLAALYLYRRRRDEAAGKNRTSQEEDLRAGYQEKQEDREKADVPVRNYGLRDETGADALDSDETSE